MAPGAHPLNVCDRNSLTRCSHGGQDLVVLLDIDNGGIGASLYCGTRARRSVGIGEGDSAEVGKLDQRAILFKVLDDPLGVELLKCVALTSEGMGHRLASGEILNDSCASRGARGGDCHRDLMSS